MSARDWRMIVGVGLPSLASGLFLPLTLVYFTVLTDIPLPLLGTLTSAAILVTVPLPVVAGMLADRWGPWAVVVASLAIQALGFAGFTIAREPWAVFAVSAVMAIGNRAYWSVIFALLAAHADSSGRRSREWWFGAANVSRTVGITLGGVITGAVITIGRDGAYVAVAAGAAVLLAAAAVVMPTAGFRSEPASGSGVLAALRDLPFVAYTLLNAVFALAVLFLGVSLPTTIRSGLEGPGWLTATFLTGNAIIVAVLGLGAARWTERRSRVRALAVAAVLWAAGYAVLALASELPLAAAVAPLALAVLAIATAEAVQAPASMAWAAEAAPEGARGRYLALFQYSWLVAEVIAPVLFASLFERSAWVPFAAVSLANLAALALLPAADRALRGRGEWIGRPRA